MPANIDQIEGESYGFKNTLAQAAALLLFALLALPSGWNNSAATFIAAGLRMFSGLKK